MKIGILTSSRADFGIYLPLIRELKKDSFFYPNIIAFGTHLSPFHGETIKQIQNEGFEVKYKVESMLLTDSPEAIATAVGLTTIKFADFWQKYKSEFDLVFCLGDRYEMFAAVTAGIPFDIPFAHLHGGESTLGAIDNIYRHAITLASKHHFVATNIYSERVASIIGSDKNITTVGALSLDNVSTMEMLSIDDFRTKWDIDLSIKTILFTFHPETIAYHENWKYVNELIQAIDVIKANYQILVTMPNADTAGNIIRNALNTNFSNDSRVFLIENLGTESYFAAMKYCSFLLGNTSSGIIEAASFGKYVINLGDRQKGRAVGNNVIHTEISSRAIINAVCEIESMESIGKENIYWNSGATNKIIEELKAIAKK
ncbi:GDP/UDP-N,N'-diacetylbacillosamine 2-epimerase (hydrolyzing) [Pedobacter sp. UYP24]